MGKVKTYHSFCFTVNNWTPGDRAMLDIFAGKWCDYMCYSEELAPTTGTRHLQGYFWVTKAHTKQNCLKKLRKGIFLGVPGPDKGPLYWTHYCVHYDRARFPQPPEGCKHCETDEKLDQQNSMVQGRMPSEADHAAQATEGQGNCPALISLKRKIDEGESVENLQESEVYFQVVARHDAYLEKYQSYKRRRLMTHEPVIYVFVGETHTGKSQVARHIGGEDTWIWNSEMGKFMNGYAGQKTVIFEEFRGQIPYDFLLQLTDKYTGIRVPIKGSHVYWSPEVIVFTSPIFPHEWYPKRNEKDSIQQLLRRITHQYHTSQVRFHEDFGHVRPIQMPGIPIPREEHTDFEKELD